MRVAQNPSPGGIKGPPRLAGGCRGSEANPLLQRQTRTRSGQVCCAAFRERALKPRGWAVGGKSVMRRAGRLRHSAAQAEVRMRRPSGAPKHRLPAGAQSGARAGRPRRNPRGAPAAPRRHKSVGAAMALQRCRAGAPERRRSSGAVPEAAPDRPPSGDAWCGERGHGASAPGGGGGGAMSMWFFPGKRAFRPKISPRMHPTALWGAAARRRASSCPATQPLHKP